MNRCHCGVSIGNTWVADLVSGDHAVILAEPIYVAVLALEALHEDVKPLGLETTWATTYVYLLGGLLHEVVESVPA